MSTCGCNLISFNMCQQLKSYYPSYPKNCGCGILDYFQLIGLEINNGSIQNKSHTALVLVI